SINLPIETIQATLGSLLSDPAIPKIAHNANYDLAVLWEHGLDVQGPLFDTMIAAWLADPGRGQIGLKELAWTRLGVEMTNIQELIGKGRDQVTMDHVAAARAAQYAGADVDMTLRLASLLEGELQDRALLDLFNQVEMPLVPILTRMEMNGILLDADYLMGLSTEFYQRMNVLEKDIYDLVGYPFNLGSTQQLASVLFEHLGLPPKKRTKTGFSTDITVLEELRGMHPVIEKLIEHRQLAKLKSTYIDALPLLVHPRSRRIHTDFNQCGSATGRISSSNPNLQNIPIRTDEGKRIRHAFIAAPGYVLLTADYSQIELRILAAMTGEPTLVEAFENDEDIHARTAALLFNIPLDQVTPAQRRLAKTTNFGIIYGISGFGLAARTDLTTDEAMTFIKNYNAKLPGVEKLMDDFKKQARRDGYVSTLLGRRRYFPGLKSGARLPLAERQRLEREAINAPVQGTAADIVKLAMVRLDRGLREAGLGGKMLLQVHDELVLEVPTDEVDRTIPVICTAMEEAFELPGGVRLKVDLSVGERWSEVADVAASEAQRG
ncbi:MAG: DNA polymerase I, partial [Anaerolineae bacterium]|nr:DNA polymerase I [Anaerolineae bacterium]